MHSRGGGTRAPAKLPQSSSLVSEELSLVLERVASPYSRLAIIIIFIIFVISIVEE